MTDNASRVAAPPAVPTADVWDRVWESYDKLAEPTTPRLVDTIAALGPAGKRICEVGCGTGKDSFKLAAMGAKVTSVDFSLRALELVQRKAGVIDGPAPALVAGDTLKLPFRDATFDILFHQGLLEHFLDPVAVLREQSRVVKPGGYLLVDVPQTFNWYAVKKRRAMKEGTWFAGWETDFHLLELQNCLRKAGLRPVKTYAYGYFPAPLYMVRHLHEVGETRFGRPLMPRPLGKVYERACQWWEGTWMAAYSLVCVGVLAQKPE